MIREAFYDPLKSYYENYENGPFGAFADGDVYPDDSSAPQFDLHGHPIAMPFGIPAGPLLNANYVKAALDKGFSIPVYKTVRSGVHASHEYPNVVPVDITEPLSLERADQGLTTKDEYTDPLSITNSFGVPSYGPEVWQPDVADAIAYAKAGQVVGVSFQGTKPENGSVADYIEDWVTTATLVAETKPAFMEANLSCPNEGTANLLCFDVERVAQIVRQIKAAVGDIPLWVKVSYFADQDLLTSFVREVGGEVDGVATINTIAAAVRTPDGAQALPGEGRLRSGVCGHTIKWAGVEMVERLQALRDQFGQTFVTAGVGGVTVPADYHEYRRSGADIVMSATGAMWNPYLAKEIKDTI